MDDISAAGQNDGIIRGVTAGLLTATIRLDSEWRRSAPDLTAAPPPPPPPTNIAAGQAVGGAPCRDPGPSTRTVHSQTITTITVHDILVSKYDKEIACTAGKHKLIGTMNKRDIVQKLPPISLSRDSLYQGRLCVYVMPVYAFGGHNIPKNSEIWLLNHPIGSASDTSQI